MISEKAYKAADIAIKKIRQSPNGKISMNELDNIIFRVQGIDPRKASDEQIENLGDFDADVRGILSMHGYATNFNNGDVTGGRTKKYLTYSTNPMKQYKMKQAKLNRLSKGY